MRIPSSHTILSTRATTITNENRSDAVTVTTWVTLVLLALVFLSREAIKYTVVRKFGIDDLLTLVAVIFAIGLSITTLRLASDGLGVFAPLTVRRANDIMKGYYASNFLYIAALGFAKLSLVTFFYSIHKVQQKHRRFVLGFGVFIFVWTLASLIAVAFQCGLPRPWEVLTLHCFDRGVFWIVYCLIDMTTDVSIIMLSVNLVIYLKVKASRKIAVVACFAPRILVIGASLARLVYLYPITPHTNPAFNLWVPVVCTQVQVSLSIVTACIPYMRPFFYSTESEVLRGDGSRRNMITADEEYGHSSTGGYLRGHKKGQGQSEDSTTSAWRYQRTPDVSPRLPSPPTPLSPIALTPPRLTTPPNSSATRSNSSRSPSERGLRLQIPPPDIHVRRATIVSPQTASSHALSPECLSPQPLLSSSATFSPIPLTPGEPTPPPRSHTPPSMTNNTYDSAPSPPIQSPTRRFSLFPSQRTPRYSLIPQPPLSIPTTISERSGASSRSHTPAKLISVPRTTPMSTTPETRTPSSSQSPQPPPRPPNPPNPSSSVTPLLPPLSIVKYPPRTTSSNFARVAYDDPLRTRAPPATALTSSAPIPAPIVTPEHTPAPAAYNAAHTSNSTHNIHTPPTANTRPRQHSHPRQQSTPSHYTTTPPSQPPTFPLPTPPASYSSFSSTPYHPHTHHHRHKSSTASLSTASPTSPQRQRNRRILTPKNSSRTFADSPISPVSPPTPIQFWREEAFGNGAGRTGVPLSGVWEEQDLGSSAGARI